MELQLGIENNVFEGALIKAIEEGLFHDLASYIEYALKLTMYNYLSKHAHLILKNDFLTDTSINCHQPKTLTHGFGFNFLDNELTFELSSKIKIKKTGHNKIHFNPSIDGAKMKFFPIRSGYIKDSTNNSYNLFFFMEGRTISNEYYQEVEFTRIARKDVIIKELKTQTNIFINKLRFTVSIKNIIHNLSSETIAKLHCKMVPDCLELCDFGIFGCKQPEMTYFNILSGVRHICSCTKNYHEYLLESHPPTIREGNFLMLSEIACLPRKSAICHLCIVREYGLDECIKRFGIPSPNLSSCFEEIAFFYNKDPKWSWIYHNLDYIFKQPKWVNEHQMFLFAKELLPEYKILREACPSWLKYQSLDVYFPEISLALEYQGKQHFEAVNFFGGEDALKKNKERDQRKRELCKKNGVHIIYVTYLENLTMELMKRKLTPFLKSLRENR